MIYLRRVTAVAQWVIAVAQRVPAVAQRVPAVARRVTAVAHWTTYLRKELAEMQGCLDGSYTEANKLLPLPLSHPGRNLQKCWAAPEEIHIAVTKVLPLPLSYLCMESTEMLGFPCRHQDAAASLDGIQIEAVNMQP